MAAEMFEASGALGAFSGRTLSFEGSQAAMGCWTADYAWKEGGYSVRFLAEERESGYIIWVATKEKGSPIVRLLGSESPPLSGEAKKEAGEIAEKLAQTFEAFLGEHPRTRLRSSLRRGKPVALEESASKALRAEAVSAL